MRLNRTVSTYIFSAASILIFTSALASFYDAYKYLSHGYRFRGVITSVRQSRIPGLEIAVIRFHDSWHDAHAITSTGVTLSHTIGAEVSVVCKELDERTCKLRSVFGLWGVGLLFLMGAIGALSVTGGGKRLLQDSLDEQNQA